MEVCILEAMKMQNSMTAARSGKVIFIHKHVVTFRSKRLSKVIVLD